VPEHKGNAFGRADIGEPVPGEHALRRHDQIVGRISGSARPKVGHYGLEEQRDPPAYGPHRDG